MAFVEREVLIYILTVTGIPSSRSEKSSQKTRVVHAIATETLRSDIVVALLQQNGVQAYY